MLEELSIRSLGVLESANAQFHPGFTVLTGETGAGKTMIVTSLRLLSGGRADAGRVRTGDAKAVVEGRFRLPEERTAIAEVLEDSGAEIDDDETLIAARTVNADGRSRAHLGGRSVPVGTLAQLTGELLAIHGQNDQLRLIRPEQQRGALDRYAGAAAASTLKKYRAARTELVEVLDELDRLRANSRDIAMEADRLRFGVDEIDAVAPEPGEDVELIATIRRMTDLEDIRRTALTAQEIIAGSENASVVDGLGTVRSLLESASDDALRELQPRVAEALTVVTDLGAELTSYLGGLPEDAGDLDALLNRQAELKSLTRKYAADIDGVLTWREEANERLTQIEDPEGAVEELEVAASAAREKVAALGAKLHAQRTKYAKSLASKVSAELTGLAMGGSALAVSVSLLPADDERLAVEIDGKRAHAGGDGVDRVEFGLVAHKGAAPLPIAKSASGVSSHASCWHWKWCSPNRIPVA